MSLEAPRFYIDTQNCVCIAAVETSKTLVKQRRLLGPGEKVGRGRIGVRGMIKVQFILNKSGLIEPTVIK